MKIQHILSIIFLLSIYACSKIEKGFQSNAIRYKDNDIFC